VFECNCHLSKEQGFPNLVHQADHELDQKRGAILVFVSCIHRGAARCFEVQLHFPKPLAHPTAAALFGPSVFARQRAQAPKLPAWLISRSICSVIMTLYSNRIGLNASFSPSHSSSLFQDRVSF
jgi:hypothetical protein